VIFTSYYSIHPFRNKSRNNTIISFIAAKGHHFELLTQV